MGAYLIIVGIILVALGLVVYYRRRSQAAETQAQQSTTAFNNFMATDLMLKNSALNSYKAMMRQPQASPPPSEFTWEQKPGDRRRF